MKKLFTTLFYTTLLVSTLILTGCKKKCDLGSDATTGEIKEEVYIFPRVGALSETLIYTQDFMINAQHMYADKFDISLDKGLTKSPINYNQYTILCYPTRVHCNATFARNVTIDDINGIVTYSIHIKDCGKCEETRLIENYVAIRAVPSHYEVIYDVTRESF